MFPAFITILLVAITLPAQAAGCIATRPERFHHFFAQFAANKQFAISRTVYPLKVETSSYGIDTQGKNISGKSLTLRPAQEDAKGESLAVEMERNALSYKVLRIRKHSAIVNVSGEGDSLLFNHHFIRIGNCWFFTKLENYSL